MAEDLIPIRETVGGTGVATHEAVESVGGESRYIQLVNPSSRKLTLTPVRGILAYVDTADDCRSNSFPAELTGNLLTCGDKSILVVAVQFYYIGHAAIITPIGIYEFDDGETVSNIYRPLESKFVSCDAENAATAFIDQSDDDNNVVTPLLAWDVLGAKQVGIHITETTGDLRVKAGMI